MSADTPESSADTLATGLPSIWAITSPGRMPACPAGPLFSTPVMITPCSPALMPKVSASSGVRSVGSTPIQPRTTRPLVTMLSITCLAIDTGMAKPMPMLPPERE